MTLSRIARIVSASAGLAAALALTGCGMTAGSTIAPVVPVAVPGGVQGIFMGGQQPVGNINIQLYAMNVSTYGGASTALLTPGSTKTTPSGNFTLPNFSCPSGSSQLYLVGTGGQPITGVTNNNLALMTALGSCQNFLSSGNFVNVNELTTVASVYALSGFMTGIANIGTSASNLVGLANAANTVNKLVNTTNGQPAVPGGASPTNLPVNATIPTSLLNTLGDIMEQCVNSSGGSASDTTDGLTNGTGCGKLFYLTPNTAGTPPTDTITAILNLAQHPTVNVAKLNDLRSASPAFSPSLSVNSPPAAWTIGISYTAGLSTPSAVAVDTAGAVWVASKGNSSVVKLDPTGAVTATISSTLSAPAGIAIDKSGNSWVTNSTANTVSKVNPSASSATAYSGSMNSPAGIAIDSNNQVWITNSGNNTVTALTNAGAAVSGSPFSGGGLSGPVAVAASAK